MSSNIDPNREELRIGRLLTAGLEEMAGGTPCLSSDQVQSLVAGNMSEDERETALNHAAGCAICRHSLLVTHRLTTAPDYEEVRENEDGKSRVVHLSDRRSPVRSYYVPLALAASLVLAVGLYQLRDKAGAPGGLTGLKTPGGETAKVEPALQVPQSPGIGVKVSPAKQDRSSTMLAVAGATAQSLTRKELDVQFASANRAGFASDSVEDSNRFHVGFALFSLAAAGETGDGATARRAAASLNERIQRLNLSAGASKSLAADTEKLATGTPNPEACRTLFAAFQNAVNQKYPADVMLDLGMWTAVLQISGEKVLAEIVRDTHFQETIRKGARLAAPRGLPAKLAEIASISGSKLDAVTANRLHELADDLQKLF